MPVRASGSVPAVLLEEVTDGPEGAEDAAGVITRLSMNAETLDEVPYAVDEDEVGDVESRLQEGGEGLHEATRTARALRRLTLPFETRTAF